jgi:hypothetical protein
MRPREWFWRWVHRQSEALWHWSYYHRVLEHEPKYKPQNILYSESEGFKKASKEGWDV